MLFKQKKLFQTFVCRYYQKNLPLIQQKSQYIGDTCE